MKCDRCGKTAHVRIEKDSASIGLCRRCYNMKQPFHGAAITLIKERNR